MRYVELKFNGKIITEQWKIDEILLDNGFKWMINAEIGNARLEILKDTLIWNGGIWYNGNWYFGVFRDGEWKYGTWENGVWYNGKWKDGTFKSGIIFRGIFIKGEILGGEIRGGSFIDCDISPKVKEYVEGEKQQEEQEKLEPPVIEPVDAETDLHVVVKEQKNNKYKMSRLKKFEEYVYDEEIVCGNCGEETDINPENGLCIDCQPDDDKDIIKLRESTGDIEDQFVGNRYDNVNVKQKEGGIELSSYSKTDIYNAKQTYGGEVIEKDGLFILFIKDKK